MTLETKELKKNTIVIAIANLGSKIISFLLAPLYSFVLCTEEYGTMDIIISTTSLLFPILCLDIFEATFRYSSDSACNKRTVISTSIVICVIPATITFLLLFVTGLYLNYSDNIIICVLAAFLESIYMVFSQYARGIGDIKIFAFSGVVNSVALLCFNVIFMIFFSLGLKGWIISYVLSKICAIIFLILRIRAWRIVSLTYVETEFAKQAVRYSAPLIMGTAMWWIMNASDRYVVTWFCGLSATGIYAVANKLPAILSTLEGIFYQSWQTSAINSVNNNDRDSFYSNIFMSYFKMLVIGTSIILVVLKQIIWILFAEDYRDAWVVAPILVISVLLHALAGNVGTLYAVFKKTYGAFKTATIGAFLNIFLNIILIKKFGLLAAAITTVFSYLIVLIIRWYDVKKYVTITIDKFECGFLTFIIFLMLFFYYRYDPYCIVRGTLVCILLCRYRKFVINIIKV